MVLPIEKPYAECTCPLEAERRELVDNLTKTEAMEFCWNEPTCWGFTQMFGNNLEENKAEYRICSEKPEVFKTSHSNLYYCKHLP